MVPDDNSGGDDRRNVGVHCIQRRNERMATRKEGRQIGVIDVNACAEERICSLVAIVGQVWDPR